MERVILQFLWKIFKVVAPYIRKITGPVYHFSGTFAGLAFIAVLILSPSVAKRLFSVDIPVVPPASDTLLMAFVVAAILFLLFASLETVAGLITWTADFVTNDNENT